MGKQGGKVEAGERIASALRNWAMVALTLMFVLLYGAVLIGWLKPLADEKMVTCLEPIIFVIIGYYFGRLPAQQNEETLKDELVRQTQRADATQHAREQAQRASEAAEEKLKNIKTALASAAPDMAPRGMIENLNSMGGPVKEAALRYSVVVALSILNS
jgi:hypothetical protein